MNEPDKLAVCRYCWKHGSYVLSRWTGHQYEITRRCMSCGSVEPVDLDKS